MGEHEMKVAFREAGPDDLTDIRGLLFHLGYPLPSVELAPVYESFLKDESCQCILALAPPDYQVVGMVTLRTFPVLRLAGYQTTIEELVVLPRWRWRGVGSALVMMAVETAQKSGSVRLEVLSSEDRESTRRMFYEKAGLNKATSRVYRLEIPGGKSRANKTTPWTFKRKNLSGELA